MINLKLLRLVGVTVLMIFTLNACGGGTSGSPTTAPTGPTTAPSGPTTAPTEPTTAPSGPTTAPTEPTTAPTEPTTAPTEPTTAPTEPTTAPTGPTVGNSVAILVADDFDPTNPPPLQADTKDDKGNCIVMPDGQGFKTGGVGEVPVGAAHGAMVSQELEDLITSRLKTKLTPNGPGSSPGVIAIKGAELAAQQNIWLVNVDTNNYTTREIADHIVNAIHDLGLPPYNTTRFVLNMSFAVIPCDPRFGLSTSNLQQLIETYRALLASDPSNQDLAYLLDLITQLANTPDADRLAKITTDPVYAQARPAITYEEVRNQIKNGKEGENPPWARGQLFGQNQADPLYLLIQDPPSGSAVISVAAAGNSGLPFPFAPGLWPNVLSISASISPNAVSLSGRNFRSNDGEVQMEGEHTSARGAGGQLLIGTSYAAPRLSLQAALYLSTGEPSKCKTPNGDFLNPPMSYAPEVNLKWLNLPLANAAKQYCEIFPSQ